MHVPDEEIVEAAWPTEPQWRDLIAHFEAGVLPKPQWTHASHVAVGAGYIHRLGLEAATYRMRDRVRHYNVCVGTVNSDSSGYHESLTRMWLLALHRLRVASADTDELTFVQLAVARYAARRDLHTRLYSFDVVASPFARREWVTPDLAPSSGVFE